MAFVNEFRCEVCGSVTGMPVLWLVIQSRDSKITILPWDIDAAHAPGAAHLCGETDAQIYIGCWMDSVFLRHKTLPFPDAEPLRTTLHDDRKSLPGRELRSAAKVVPIRSPQEQAALPRS